MRESRLVDLDRVGVACALVSTLLVVLPLTGSLPSLVAEMAVISLALLAATATLAGAPRQAPLLLRPALMTAAGADATPPLLRSRTVDPTHHPLAPRAPGLR